MRGATPPLLQYAFMAWCSVKAQGQLYLTLVFRSYLTIQNLMHKATELVLSKFFIKQRHGYE
jgi:hypothetical protein